MQLETLESKQSAISKAKRMNKHNSKQNFVATMDRFGFFNVVPKWFALNNESQFQILKG